MTQTTPDPITTQERVLVRSTATGFEQGIAAVAGFFTAGPLGSVAAWGALRGLQGKWAPWFILGVPASIAINIVQLTIIAAIFSAGGEQQESYEPVINRADAQEQVVNI